MSETIPNFETVDLPTARRTAPASPAAAASPAVEQETQRARIVTPGEGNKPSSRKLLLIGAAMAAVIAVGGATIVLKQQATPHFNGVPGQPYRPASNSMHAGAGGAQVDHGPAALKIPAPEQGPADAKVSSSATAVAGPQSSAGRAPATAAQPTQDAPGESQDDARPAPAPMQQVVSILLKRLSELEAAQKQEEAARKAQAATLEQNETAITATVNREAGRLDEISSNLHSLVIASQSKAPTETNVPSAPVAPAAAPTLSAASHNAPALPPAAKKDSSSTVITHAESERRVRYAIDAASPEIAIVHTAGGRAIEVRVGDVLPGYGHVTLIEQQGDAWVVRTDRGTIR